MQDPRKKATSEPVNPKHYKAGSVDCIEALESMEQGGSSYHLISAVKYLWRAHLKGNPIQDCQKAIWYIERFMHNQTKESSKMVDKQWGEQ